MRDMRSRKEAKTVFAGREHVVIVHRTRRTTCKIIDADDGAHEAASWCCLGRHFEPLIQSSTFIGFEMAETYPAQFCGIDHLCHGLSEFGKYMTHSSMEK